MQRCLRARKNKSVHGLKKKSGKEFVEHSVHGLNKQSVHEFISQSVHAFIASDNGFIASPSPWVETLSGEGRRPPPLH
jgi:hypothetical protein